MDTYTRFLYEFISIFFKGVGMIFGGIFNGFAQIFNFKKYLAIINYYQKEFNMPEWVLVVIAVVVMLLLLGVIVFILVMIIRKYIRFRKSLIEQESMLEEIGNLNKEVSQLVIEKQKILAMKVSQLGLRPGVEDLLEETE